MFRCALLAFVCVAGLTTTGPSACQDPAGGVDDVPQIPVLGAFNEGKVTALLSKMKTSEKMKSLLKARLEAAKVAADSRAKEFVNGRGTLDFLLGASQHLLESELDLSESKPDQIAAHEAHLKLLRLVQNTNQERYDAGRIPIQDLKESEYYLLDAEIALEKLKAK